MNDITNPVLQFRGKTERQSDALEELRQLHRDHEMLQAQIAQYRHTVGQLQFRVEFLSDQLTAAQQNERVATRKLVRLADRVALMGELSREASEIVRSAEDWQEADQEQHQEEVPALPTTANRHAEIDQRLQTPTEGEGDDTARSS